MRLIDADKLCDELKEVSKLKGTTDKGKERARYIAEFIDFWGDVSTIEAIPIEWLNKVIEHYRENGWHDDAEDLELLINDWREALEVQGND